MISYSSKSSYPNIIGYNHCNFSNIRLISSEVILSTFWVYLLITIISTLFLLIFYYIVYFKEPKASFLASYKDIFFIMIFVPHCIYRSILIEYLTLQHRFLLLCIRSSFQKDQFDKCKVLFHQHQLSIMQHHRVLT